MGLRVCSQIALVGKPLVTDITGERLLAGVGANVSLEQPGAGEDLAAEGAGAAPAVCPLVHVEGCRAAVGLVTPRTPVLGLSRTVAVLHVLLQAGGAAKGLAA